MSSKRILLLEGDRMQARAIEQMILQAGHLVVGPVHTLEDALEQAVRSGFDFAIL